MINVLSSRSLHKFEISNYSKASKNNEEKLITGLGRSTPSGA